MSYFLCLAVPQKIADEISTAFGPPIYISNVSDFPIGRATIGKHKNWSAYILQIEASSASLIAGGVMKKSPKHDRSSLFVAGIQSLFAKTECSRFCFLAHWMHGYISTESIIVQDEEEVSMLGLPSIMKNIREDVLYTIVGEETYYCSLNKDAVLRPELDSA